MTVYHQIIEQWFQGNAELAPVTRLLRIRPEKWAEGSASIGMTAGPEHHNAMGTVHGGIMCDLADVAMGVAFASTLKDGESFTTLELHANYFHSVREGKLAATAGVLRRGGGVGYVECEIHDDAGRLIAKMASTCMGLKMNRDGNP
jgi:uncharacterized protein (TIGR00369 family)